MSKTSEKRLSIQTTCALAARITLLLWGGSFAAQKGGAPCIHGHLGKLRGRGLAGKGGPGE
jgi:hypothetical protein